MSGERVGYIRVSTFGQNTDRQLDNVHLDKKFIERVSGKDSNRPQLDALLDYVRDGDMVIVHSMDRLARNLDDLRKIVFDLTSQNINVEFIKESLIFTGEDSPMSTLLLSVMGAFAEFERTLIKERQMEGIDVAKNKGLYRGRKLKLTEEQELELFKRIANGESKSTIAMDLQISRETLYKYLRKDRRK